MLEKQPFTLYVRSLIYTHQTLQSLHLVFWYGKLNRDTTILIDVLFVHYSSLFQYFFAIYCGPYSNNFLVYLFVNIFWKHYYYDYEYY